jgi:glycosyltransferase involved in cell wall biosynthesis
VLITIIIPTYNQAQYIANAVKSVLQQSYKNIQIIIADDGSSDDTEQIISQFEDSRIVYLKNIPNKGRVNNYHDALYNHAMGEYVALLDGDDYYINANFICDAVAQIQSNAANDILFFQAKQLKLKTWKTNEVNYKQSIIAYNKMQAHQYVKEFPNHGYSHFGTLYNKRFALDSGFYLKDIGGSDMDSFLRLCLNNPNRSVILSNQYVGVWVKHGENTSYNLSTKDYFQSSVLLFRNISQQPNAKQYGINLFWVIRLSIKPIVAYIVRCLGIKF